MLPTLRRSDAEGAVAAAAIRSRATWPPGADRHAEDGEDGRGEVGRAAPAEDGRHVATRAAALAGEHVEPRAARRARARRLRRARSGRWRAAPGTRCARLERPRARGRRSRSSSAVAEARAKGAAYVGSDATTCASARRSSPSPRACEDHEGLPVRHPHPSIPREQGLEGRVEERRRVAAKRRPGVERRRSDEPVRVSAARHVARRAGPRASRRQAAVEEELPSERRRRGVHRERGPRERERADVGRVAQRPVHQRRRDPRRPELAPDRRPQQACRPHDAGAIGHLGQRSSAPQAIEWRRRRHLEA